MVQRSCWKSRHKSSCGRAPHWIRPGLLFLFSLCVTQFTYSSGSVGETKHVVQKDAEFDVVYNHTVTSENQTIYAFNHTVSRNKVSFPSAEYLLILQNICCDIFFNVSAVSGHQTEGVRVSVDVLSHGLESPVLIVVRQKQAVLSFQVPLILRGL